MGILDRFMTRDRSDDSEESEEFTYRLERMSYKGGWQPVDVDFDLDEDTPVDLIQFNYVDEEPPGRFRLTELDSRGNFSEIIWNFETAFADKYYQERREEAAPERANNEEVRVDQSEDSDEEPEPANESEDEPDPMAEVRIAVLKNIEDNFDEYPLEVQGQIADRLLGLDTGKR